MEKIAILLIIGLVVLSLFWSNPTVLAQEPGEPTDGDGDAEDGGTITGEPPGTGEGEPLGENTTGGQGEQERGSPLEIPIFVPLVIIIVVIVAVIALLVRRRKPGEYTPESPEFVPSPPVEAGAPIFTPAV